MIAELVEAFVVMPVGAAIGFAVSNLKKDKIKVCTDMCCDSLRYQLCFDGRCRHHCRQACRCEEG